MSVFVSSADANAAAQLRAYATAPRPPRQALFYWRQSWRRAGKLGQCGIAVVVNVWWMPLVSCAWQQACTPAFPIIGKCTGPDVLGIFRSV